MLKLYRRSVIIINPILNMMGSIDTQFTELYKDEISIKLNNLKNKLTSKKAIKF